MTKQELTLERMIMMNIADNLKLLVWAKTEDGMKGRNRPVSWFDIFNGQEQESELSFDSGEEFEKARQLLMEGGQ